MVKTLRKREKKLCRGKIQRKGFPCGSAGKESACNGGDLGSIPGLERSPGEGKGSLLQYSGLEDSVDCVVPGVAKSQTRLSGFHSHFKGPLGKVSGGGAGSTGHACGG